MGAPARLGLAGLCATAVSFGPARNGYGLFLPRFREEFGLSTEVLGLIASGLYAGYLAALVAVGLLAAKTGPRLPVGIGLLSAAGGTALVAFSPSTPLLAAGVVLAGASAGWTWAPYNDAVERTVPARSRDRVLSVVSTGTTFGIAVAGLAALAAGAYGLSWRAAWLAFAFAALVSAALNAALLPRGAAGSRTTGPGRPGFRWFWCGASAPLFAVALAFGVVNAVYWSFAVDLISGPNNPSSTTGPLFYAALGVFGSAGLFTGEAVARFGLRPTLAATLVSLGAASGLLGLAPRAFPAIGASAVLFGVGVMFMSALLSLWSSAVFRGRPSAGFSAALLLFGIGSVVGPALAGAAAGAFGLRTVFLFVAALCVLATFVRPASVGEKGTREG